MEIRVLASGSAGNAYRISDGTTALLLEAGIPFKQIQKSCGFQISHLAGCLITHEHMDHCRAARDLLYRGVDLYASAGTITALGLSGHRVHAIEAKRRFRIRTLDILPFDVEHDAAEPLGFLIVSAGTGEKLLFVTDTFYLKYRFDGLTHIMAECNYERDLLMRNVESGAVVENHAARVIKSHMSLETLVRVLQANDMSKVRQIYLMHLSDDNSDADRFKRTIQQLTGVEVYICN